MKLSKLIILLEEQYDKYRSKYGKDPVIYVDCGELVLCSKITKKEPGYFAYEKPYMKLPKAIAKALEVDG